MQVNAKSGYYRDLTDFASLMKLWRGTNIELVDKMMNQRQP